MDIENSFDELNDKIIDDFNARKNNYKDIDEISEGGDKNMVYCSCRLFDSVLSAINQFDDDLSIGVYYYPGSDIEDQCWTNIVIKEVEKGKYQLYGKVYVTDDALFISIMTGIINTATLLIQFKKLDEKDLKSCICIDSSDANGLHYLKNRNNLPADIIDKMSADGNFDELRNKIYDGVVDWLNKHDDTLFSIDETM